MSGAQSMGIADFLGVELREGALAFDLSRAPRSKTINQLPGSRQIDLMDSRGIKRGVLRDWPANTLLTIMARSSDPSFEVEIAGNAKRVRLHGQNLTLTLEIADKKRVLVDPPLHRKYADLAFDDGEHLFCFGLVEVVPSI
jgi:hypothetical protein